MEQIKTISYSKLIEDSKELANVISNEMEIQYVYGVPNGGILPASIIAQELDAQLIDETELKSISPYLLNVLVVDDLIDSGKTLEKFKIYPTAVLYRKPHSPKTTWYVEEINGWIELPHEKNTKNEIETHFTRILEYIGENPNRTGLKDTPARMARFYKEAFRGYGECNLKLTTFPNGDDGIKYDQMVFDKGYFYSFCEHHMVPFFGEYFAAYIPNKKVIGLSKIAQIIDYYAARLQVQERLVQQVGEKLNEVLKPLGVAVILKGRHLCREMRDVKKHKAEMITSVMLGKFKTEATTRDEFLKLCNLN